jgi:hypothetical protein
MGYLICQDCGGYYKLREGESPEDFVSCECYGSLVYVEKLDESFEKEKQDIGSDNNKTESESLDENIGETKEESKQESVVESDLNHVKKEPTVKNRAYYRRFDYYSEPDIDQLKHVNDVAGLINALYYDDLDVKVKAAKALAVIGDERALEYLDKLIKEESGTLKMYAEIAVNQIKSRKYGFKSRDRNYYRNIDSESSKPIPKPINKPTPKPIPEIRKKINKESDVDSAPEMLMGDKSVESSEPEVLIADKIVESSEPEEPISAESLESIAPDRVKDDLKFDKISTVESAQKSKEVVTSSDVASSDDTSSEKESFTYSAPEVLTEDKSVMISAPEESIPDESSKTITSDNVESDLNHDKGSAVTSSSSVESQEVKTSNVKFSDVNSPEVGFGVDNTEFKSSEEIKNDIPLKTIPIGMKTVDDSELSETSVLPVDKTFAVRKDSSPTGTLTNKTGTLANKNRDESRVKADDNIYFIKWLGVKNTDKPLIGFIILFVFALIVGVILTMNST